MRPILCSSSIMRLACVALCAIFILTAGLLTSGTNKLATTILGAETAKAQQVKRKRRSLFGILFGRRNVKKKAVKTRKRAGKVRKQRRTKTAKRSSKRSNRTANGSRGAASAAKAVAAVNKAENAKKVLVIGDFFAGSMADGLEEAYAGLADIIVVDRSNGLSGLVREDVVKWPEKLKELVEAEKPDHIVAMLGSNDRQLLRQEGKRLKKRTEEWDATYKGRVVRLANALKTSGVNYTWMGLPPVRFKNMNRDFLVFNSFYNEAAQSPRGRFVDVWDGFSDADGNYSRSGPDVNGQIVLLRPKDGINMNKAGKRRLAFYIQDDLQKQLINSTSKIALRSLPLNFSDSVPRTATYDPASSGRTVVISLDDPKIDGADILAGETVTTGAGTSDAFRVPVQSSPVKAIEKEGRADNYRWPPQQNLPSQTQRETAQN